MKLRFRLILGLLVAGLATSLSFGAPIPLVNHGDSWRYRKGTNAVQGDWKTASDAGLDATWLTGNGGIGYAGNAPERINCQTILTDMQGTAATNYTTLYLRRTFNVASTGDTNLHLFLRMDWDDGYIAWLDGVHLTNNASPGAPAEPAFSATASNGPNGHESSAGDNSPQPAVDNDLGAVGNRLGVGNHVLAILGLNVNKTSSDFIQVADLFLSTNSTPTNCVSGAIAVNTTWYASNSPIVLCGSVTVNSGVTLTIQPGVTVQLGSAVDLTVANGGRLLAEGTSNAPIHFTRFGASGNWGNITINGAVGSIETRIAYADFQFNVSDVNTPCIEVMDGTAYLDHLTFGNTDAPYIHVDAASFVISHCHFPAATDVFEPCHGTGGVKSGGHGIFQRNFFGKAMGYSDVVDFTGSQRGGPIVHFINNVVTGSDDDGWDLDGTDAWVEGNIFLHMHRNSTTPDSSSAISGGNTGSDTSEVTIIGNIIYDCDQAVDAKQGNFYTMFNNTIVHQTHIGGVDPIGAIVITADIVNGTPTTEGAGVYLEGNVIYDAEQLTRNLSTAIVTFTNNLMPFSWAGPGGGNSTNNPLLKHIPLLSETTFTNWAQAQIMRDWFSLLTNSPGLGSGPNGRDKGAVIPIGASISGEPTGTTTNTSATLRVGINRTGHGIPTAGWPNGSGYVAYKWRLDTNAWSAELPIATPITLTGLANGSHHVEVTGKRDSGLYQDDPLFGEDAVVTLSRTWFVQSSLTITSAAKAGNSFILHFPAAAGNTYTVQYKDALTPGNWSKLADVPAQPVSRDVAVTNAPATGTNRFYRIVTPAQ
ncbi:MAG TPA: hypothetical protein VGK40_12205 [Verrucomicrobiae bacterium]|jgi:hypothetical protein